MRKDTQDLPTTELYQLYVSAKRLQADIKRCKEAYEFSVSPLDADIERFLYYIASEWGQRAMEEHVRKLGLQ